MTWHDIRHRDPHPDTHPRSGTTVLLQVLWNGDYNYLTGYFGEEDLFFTVDNDSVIDDVQQWAYIEGPQNK